MAARAVAESPIGIVTKILKTVIVLGYFGGAYGGPLTLASRSSRPAVRWQRSTGIAVLA
jgi:hypothetical protein